MFYVFTHENNISDSRNSAYRLLSCGIKFVKLHGFSFLSFLIDSYRLWSDTRLISLESPFAWGRERHIMSAKDLETSSRASSRRSEGTTGKQ